MIAFKASLRLSLRRAATIGGVFALSAIALTLIYYPDLHRRDGIFDGADHLYYMSSYLASRRFGSLLDLQTFPFGQGFGTFQHPALPNPLWWIWEATNSDQLTYFAAMFVLFCGVLAFYLSLREKSIFWAIFAALICGTAVFNSYIMADYYGTGMPQTYFQIGVAYFGGAILLGFGPRSTRWLLFGIALLSFAVVMDWPYAMFLSPFLLLSASAALLTFGAHFRTPGRQVNWRQAIVVAGVCAAVAAVLLLPIYTAYDSFTLMSLRLWQHAFTPHETKHSLLLWGGLPAWKSAMILGWTGLLAAVYHILRDRSRLRILSLGLVLILSVLAYLDNDAAGSNVFWPLPALGYFERPLLPLYVILFSAAIEDMVSSAVGRYLRGSKPAMIPDISWIGLAPLLLSITAAGGTAAFAALGLAAWPEGGRLNEVVFRNTIEDRKAETFVRELALPPPVWPLYAPYFYDGTARQVMNDCQHVHQTLGQNYCWYMFNRYSAPNAIETQNLLDIQFPSIQSQLTGSISHSLLDPSHLGTLMKSFGIRYVAVDGHWPSAMKYIEVHDQQVSLIDLGLVRPEDLSIDKVLAISSVADNAVAARIEHQAIVHDEKSFRENQSLSPVDFVDIGYGRSAVAIRARSKGNAVLLLPFQFSNCLGLDNSGNSQARLMRVNGVQAALSFAQEAEVVVRNEFRLFGRPTCRYRDFVEVYRLGLYPVQTVDEITDGYRVPLLMRWYLTSRVKKRDRLLLQRDREVLQTPDDSLAR